MCLGKPKMDPRTREDVNLYGIDDLRRMYQAATSSLIRLRDSNLKTEELKAEIRWRMRRDAAVSRGTFAVALVAAIAAIVAAIEGWPHAK